MSQQACIRRVLIVGNQNSMPADYRGGISKVLPGHPRVQLILRMHYGREVGRVQRFNDEGGKKYQQRKNNFCPGAKLLPAPKRI